MPKQPDPPEFLVTLSCPDQPGIVADVGRFLVDHGCNIVESAQYFDVDNGRFFLRTSFQSLRGRSLGGKRLWRNLRFLQRTVNLPFDAAAAHLESSLLVRQGDCAANYIDAVLCLKFAW